MPPETVLGLHEGATENRTRIANCQRCSGQPPRPDVTIEQRAASSPKMSICPDQFGTLDVFRHALTRCRSSLKYASVGTKIYFPLLWLPVAADFIVAPPLHEGVDANASPDWRTPEGVSWPA